MEEIVIKVENLSKSFKIPFDKNKSLKGSAVSLFKGKDSYELKALKSVDFDVKKGEFLGIIGRNGCGKSTLLKILAQIYVPSSGKVTINGRISPFLELGVGFNPELSARENVYLNGTMLGLTKKEIDAKFDEIVQFAELENFIDQKLRNFSSGMQVRLAFSIAIQAHAEILLIDEVLAVGDMNFQEKCYHKFRQLKAEGRTIVFVTHDMNSVKNFCNRAILINNGKIEVNGSVDRAIQRYKELNEDDVDVITTESTSTKERWGNNKIVISKITLTDNNGKPKRKFRTGEDLTISLNYQVNETTNKPNFAVTIYRDDGLYCHDTNTDIDSVKLNNLKKKGKIVLTYKSIPLYKGSYFFKIGVYNDYDKETLDFYDDGPAFTIVGDDRQFGVAKMEHNWRIDNEGK